MVFSCLGAIVIYSLLTLSSSFQLTWVLLFWRLVKRSFYHRFVFSAKPVMTRNIWRYGFCAALGIFQNKRDTNYFDKILLRIVMKTVIWKKMYGLKCLRSLLLYSHFSQSALKKGFHSMSHLASVIETDENESDSNGDMNQNGRYSNAEDYSQVIIFLFFKLDLVLYYKGEGKIK